MEELKKELEIMVDGIIAMTEESIETFYCEIEDCFPCWGKREVVIDGKTYTLMMEIKLEETK